MKTRILSAIFMIMLVAPFIILGGNLYFAAIYVLSLVGLKEFINIRETKKSLPIFVRFISYILMTLFIFTIEYTTPLMTLDIRLLSGIFIAYLVPLIIYNDNKVYSVVDAFYLITAVLFLGFSFSMLILVRNISINHLLFVLLIPIVNDSYAYITGSLIGKTKLLESISPKKTVEGAIGGLAMAVIVCSYFYTTIIDPTISSSVIITITIFLSIISQFGDLIFSSIKRYFGKKDYSDLIPGHGGILDRLDSLIFVLIAYVFLLSML